MITVKTVKEMKEAVNAGKSPIMPGNKKMAATFYALKIGQALTDKFKRKPTKGELASEIVIIASKNAEAGAIADTTIVALSIIASVSAISILAVCLKRKIRLKFNPDGSVELVVE